jgi:hypothetical protein
MQGPAATDTLTTGHFVACWASSLGVPENISRAEGLVYTSLTSLVTSNAILHKFAGCERVGGGRTLQLSPQMCHVLTTWEQQGPAATDTGLLSRRVGSKAPCLTGTQW